MYVSTLQGKIYLILSVNFLHKPSDFFLLLLENLFLQKMRKPQYTAAVCLLESLFPSLVPVPCKTK